MKMSNADNLLYTTVRIEVKNNNNGTSVGTGFFYELHKDDAGTMPIIVTNKHVVENSISCSFHMNYRIDDVPYNIKSQIPLDASYNEVWHPHPNPQIDLCFMYAGGIIKKCEEKSGITLYYIPIQESLIIPPEKVFEYDALEDVIMVGYPSGLWDSFNNTPIIRKGVTATPIYYDYLGKPEFLTDIAVFPGSSGSPVFLYNNGIYASKNEKPTLGYRLRFLGILYSGFMFDASGEIKTVNPITDNMLRVNTQIPMNLGVVIKATELLEFKNIAIPPVI